MNRFVSRTLNFVPIVAEVKGGIEFITGRDAVTNEKLNEVDRVMGVIPVAGKFLMYAERMSNHE